MTAKKMTAITGLILGVMLAAVTQSGAQAFPSGVAKTDTQRGAETVSGNATDWQPPEGFTHEVTYAFWPEEDCRTKGEDGVSRGEWKKYICHMEYFRPADLW